MNKDVASYHQGFLVFAYHPKTAAGKSLRRITVLTRLTVGMLYLVLAANGLFASSNPLFLGTALRTLEQAQQQKAPQAALIQTSEEAETLLARAEEGLQRKDWKLVTDSLQRIIDLEGNHLLAADNQLYVSARSYAQQKLADLPQAGLQAYRLVYNGQASSLFGQAREQHDLSLLRHVVEHYLLTSHGDEAALTLANWLIDQGRFAQADSHLRSIQDIYPDPDISDWIVLMRRAICAAMLNQPQNALNFVARLKRLSPHEDKVTGQKYRQRIKQLETFVSRHTSTKQKRVEDWPMRFGGPERQKRMPYVEPALKKIQEWIVSLPLGPLDENKKLIRRFATTHGFLPTRNFVTNGEVLIVKGLKDMLALDAETFSLLWNTKNLPHRVSPVQIARMQHMPRRLSARFYPDEPDENPSLWLLLEDHLSGQVNLAFDLALSVEWTHNPPPPARLRGKTEEGRRFVRLNRFAGLHSNTIVARSIEDGTLVWQSHTRQAEQTEALDQKPALPVEVQYLAAPIPVGNQLVVPCRTEADVYAAVIDPQNGRVTKAIYLCGIGGGYFESLAGLDPCVVDGMIYLPTGRGILAAVESGDWSLRWLLRYSTPAQQEQKQAQNNYQQGWLNPPLLSTGNVILFAPNDADRLFCIDRLTGQIRWQTDRGQSRYLLQADSQHVWLGGYQIRKISLSDGQGIWQQNVSEPTGRAIISGQHIYAPTRDGLLAFRANTGQAVESDAAHIKTPLGNLLAWNGALYSVGLFEVRKFPDLERGYSQALASYKQQPQDPSRALRLAWLERLKGRPQNALDVLSTLDESLATENPSRYAEVNHLRVQLLLALAKNLKAHEPGRLDYLQDAACLAQTEHDRLETAFALGNHHQMAGSPLRACEQYLSLLVSPLGDRLMQMDENLEQRARFVAEKRIRNSLHRLDEEQRGTFRKKLNNLLADASAEKRKKILNNLAQCTSLADITGRAALQVGIHAVNQWQYEKAEYFFHRILEHAINKRLKAEALARLAAIYLLPGQLHLPLSAVTQLDRLKKNYPDIQLPARVIQTAQLPDPGNDPESQGTEEAVTIAASGLVKQLRHKIDQQKLAYHRTAQQPVSLGPPKPEKAVFEVYPNARPLLIRNNESEALIDSFLLLTLEEQVKAYSRREGQLRWSADLELPGELAVESRTDDMIRRRGSISRPIEHIASGLADGQTLIVNTAEGLHAVGLTTGRRLWAVPFVPPQPAKRPKDPSGYDAWMWIHNGLLVSIDSRGRLEAAPSYAGKQVRWRKELDPLDPWYIVRCRNDHVVVLDATMNKVQIIRLSDGVTMGHGKFKQPFPLEPISLSIYDEIIVGPISEKEIAACELSAPGVQRWRLSMPGLLSQMFKPAEDLLGVSDDDGHIKIVEPASGEVSFEGVVPACRDGGVTGGLLKDGLLYVWGYQHREVERTRRNRIRWAIAVIELESGLIVWQKRDLPPDTYLQPKIFKDSSNAVPLVTMQRKDQQPIVFPAEVRNRYPELSQAPDLRGAVRLTVLDKRTGEPIGESVALPIPRQSAADRILNVDIYPGFIGVEAGAARFHFPVGQLQQEQGDAKGQKTKQTADTNKE